MAMKQILKKIRMYVKPKYLLKSRIRRCRCCGKIAPIIQFGVDDEMRRCLFCRANGRYEYISEESWKGKIFLSWMIILL